MARISRRSARSDGGRSSAPRQPLSPPMAIHSTTSSAALGEAAATASPNSSLYAALEQRNIPALNGIRAISVFLVIFYHLGMERGLPLLPGPLGVLAFFVLSGFLITWLL